jgi:hypothetical protein
VLSITSEEIQALQENILEISKAMNPQPNGGEIEQVREYELFQKPSEELNQSIYFIEA